MWTWQTWGSHPDVAAVQTSFITRDGLDSNSVTVSKTVHALLITKCEGKALSLVSLDWMRGEHSRKSARANVESAQQRP